MHIARDLRNCTYAIDSADRSTASGRPLVETWDEYVTRVTAGAQQKEVADAAGIDQSSISRWKQGKYKGTPDAAKVVALARALKRPPVEALVAAGYITDDEAHETIEVRPSAAALTDDDLARELLSRLDTLRRDAHAQRHAWTGWGYPVDPVPGAGEQRNHDQ